MTTYKISVDGCDDSTTVFLDLTDEVAAGVKEVAAAITDASAAVCMPRMSIDEVNASSGVTEDGDA